MGTECIVYNNRRKENRQVFEKRISDELVNRVNSDNSSLFAIDNVLGNSSITDYLTNNRDVIDDRKRKSIAYAYEQLSGVSPMELSTSLTRYAALKINTTGRKAFRGILERIGKKNGVDINFHKNSSQRQVNGVLGWYHDGTINYNINEITIDTYMHEFSHMWLKVLSTKNNHLYNSILSKTNAFLQTDNPIAILINERLSHFESEHKSEEAAAILTGIVSIPSLMRFVGNELSLPNMKYSEISDTFGSDIAELYELVKEETELLSLKEVNIETATLFSVLEEFVQNAITGNNPFGLHGETLEELKLIGNLDGYMENNTNMNNVVTSISNIKNLLKNDISGYKELNKMTDEQLNIFIDENLDRFIPKREYDETVWRMMGIEIPIEKTATGVTTDSKLKIREFIRTIATKQIDTWIDVTKKLQEKRSDLRKSPNNNPAVDTILEEFKTSFGNDRFNVITAKQIADVLGLSTGVHRIIKLSDAHTEYPHLFGGLDMNLFDDIDVMVVMHNDPRGDEPTVQLSLFLLEKLVEYVNPTSQTNIFNKFESIQDTDMIMAGAMMRNDSSSISNVMLGMVAGHIANKVSNLRLRTVGTLEMTRNFKFSLVENKTLFKVIGHMNNIPEIMKLIQNDEIKNIIQRAAKNEYKLEQSVDDVLRIFYYNSAFYNSPETEFARRESYTYIDMMDNKYERKEFIKARMRSIEQYYGVDVHNRSGLLENPEYLLLSRALKDLSDESFEFIKGMDYEELGFYSFATKSLALPHNVKSDTAQWFFNTVQENERLITHHYRKYRDKFHEVLLPVWEQRSGVVQSYLRNVGSEAFKHLFKKVKKDGVEFVLPYIYWSGHKDFEGMSDYEKKLAYARLGLNEDDIKLGDFIMEQIEFALVEAEFVDLKNKEITVKRANDITKEDALKSVLNRGWRKETGQLFVISKSANELTMAGKVGASYERLKTQSLDVNALYENQIVLEQLGTFRNALLNQLDHVNLLKMAGVELQKDNEYRLFDKDKNDIMSTNIENIVNYAVLSSYRQMIHQRESEFAYKAVRSMLYNKKINSVKKDATAFERLENYVDNYWDAVVKGIRMDDDITMFLSKANPNFNIAAGADIISRGLTYSLIAFRPLLVLKSFSYNMFNALAWSIGNLTGRQEGLPNMFDMFKAFKIYSTEMRRVQAWGEHYQIANASAYETINSVVQNVTNRHFLNDQVGFLALQLTDEAWRHITMVAYMIREGSWDAHQFYVDKKGNGILAYHEIKDERMYKNGKITEEGKVLREALKNDLIKTGLMSSEPDAKLPYGYDMQEATMIKTLADKFVIGSMSADASANVTYNLLGRHFSKFRRFVYDSIANLGVGTDPTQSRILSRRVVLKDENGNLYSKKEMRQVIGLVQSLGTAISIIRKHKLKSPAELAKMRPAEKAPIIRAVAQLSLYFLLKGLFGRFNDEEEKRTYLIDLHQWFIDTIVFHNISDMGRTPFPMWSAVRRMIDSGINDPLRLLYYLPGGMFVKDTKRIYDYIQKEDDLYDEVEVMH